ncbi:uncharacterized protein DSM5745_11268 [Aspergillus mulundensis]|uniref:Condensation domain-containing protein n=1 Tax=Aspergillus mulundensis TaxID=1810919 RepID=A0A3D8QA81_9EURO|nr:hypothetical protein DSM5745_11268 [Aspergillus mulundensis]RDW58577.1 hypothetical protein DSM5745_11268 [Aspergillus mulundensis]
MAWTQQGEYWSRPLDCHDRQFQVIAEFGKPQGREQAMLMGVVQLQTPDEADIDLVSQLRAAWKALRLKHPDIALVLDNDEKRYYPVRDEQDLEGWCDATFRVEKVPSSDEVLGEIMPMAAPHATCHWVPASNQLCLVSSHWRWDCRGIIKLLHCLLSELASPTPLPATFDGDEARHLVPSLDVVLGMPDTLEPAWEARADELIASAMSEENQVTIGLPISPGRATSLPGNTRRVGIRIAAEQALALRQSCRKHGVTLTTAVHASIIAETARVCTTDASKYVAPALFDLRRYCPPPSDGPTHAASLRMLALPLTVNAHASWSELAHAIQPIYRQSFDPEKSNMLFVRVPYVNKVTALLQGLKDMDIHPAQDSEPHLSSLGVIDGQIERAYGDVEVRDVSFMIQMLTGQVLVYFWSWGGEMRLAASYNEAYYSRDQVDRWLEAVRENLVENLLGRAD